MMSHTIKNGNNSDKTVKSQWLNPTLLRPNKCTANSSQLRMRMVSGRLESQTNNSFNLSQTQSAPHQDALNTSTQTPRKPNTQWTTESHTSVWTEISKAHLRTSRLPRELLDTTGLELIRLNTQTQPRRLTTTSPQNSTVTSLTPKETWLPPKRSSTTLTVSHELRDRFEKM